MRKLFCALFLLFAFSAHASDWADYERAGGEKKSEERRGVVGFGAGIFFTDTLYNDTEVSGGYHLNLMLEHYPLRYLGWGIDLGYMDSTVETRYGPDYHVNTSFTSYHGDAMLMLRLPFKRVEFYGGAGGAVFINAVEDKTTFDDGRDDKHSTTYHSTTIGWVFKGGARVFLFDDMFLGVEGRYYTNNANRGESDNLNNRSVSINIGMAF